jgi:hypothetical protein
MFQEPFKIKIIKRESMYAYRCVRKIIEVIEIRKKIEIDDAHMYIYYYY